jgi:hypothetical protein
MIGIIQNTIISVLARSMREYEEKGYTPKPRGSAQIGLNETN